MFQQTHLFSKEVILYILHIKIQYYEKNPIFYIRYLNKQLESYLLLN